MSLTYDQMSDLSMAFQEAHIPADRRRGQRIRQRIAADITEWEDDRPGRTFGVMIEDFSPTGVGMVHSGRLRSGRNYVLEIPRLNCPTIRVLLTVVRCEEVDGGMFSTRMKANEILIGRRSGRKHLPRAPIYIVLLILLTAGALACYLAMLRTHLP